MIALPNHTFCCPHCGIQLRLRDGVEHTSGACPSCHGWLHAPRKMAMNPQMPGIAASAGARTAAATGGASQPRMRSNPDSGSFSSLCRNVRTEGSRNNLPPRRDGVPPRLLGDHPAQIAQTSVPTLASRPKIDPEARRREVRAARRWDNAKMVLLSLLVFGLIAGTIQWTKMTGSGRANAVETHEVKVDDNTTQAKVESTQAMSDEQQPQVASR